MTDQYVSTDDEIVAFVDEPDKETGADDASGTSPSSLSMPDESPRVELSEQAAKLVRQEIDRERERAAGSDKVAIKVDTNNSGEIRFTRLTVYPIQPVQICREKPNRGRVIISVISPSDLVWIGLHAGIQPEGTDTWTLGGNDFIGNQEFRTNRALWAVSQTQERVIQVAEEFD